MQAQLLLVPSTSGLRPVTRFEIRAMLIMLLQLVIAAVVFSSLHFIQATLLINS